MLDYKKIAAYSAVILGIVLLILGLILDLIVLPSMTTKSIDANRVLGFTSTGEYTESTAKWINPPYNISLQMYFFDVQNRDGVMLRGEKPDLKERGPYTYRIQQVKHNVTFLEQNTQLTYHANVTFFYSPEMSCAGCSLDDNITIPNLVLNQVAQLIRNEGPFVKLGLGTALTALGESLYTTQSVRDLTFNGYKDNLIALLNRPIIGQILKRLNVTLPERIGLLYGKNGTDDGTFLIQSGKTDIDQVGVIQKWQNPVTNKLEANLDSTGWWSDQFASMINGSDGSLYKPDIDKDYRPYSFETSLCRSTYIQYQKKTDIEDIPTYRFVRSTQNFNNDGNNLGFCWPREQKIYDSDEEDPRAPGKYCLSNGLVDVSKCRKSPIVMSAPHFLGCANDVIDSVDGLAPSASEHESINDLEPLTGVSLNMAEKTQINAIILQDKNIPQVSRVHSLVHPIAWLNERAIVDQQTRDQLYSELIKGRGTAVVIFNILIILGVVLILLGLAGIIIIFIMQRRAMRVGVVEGDITSSPNIDDSINVPS